MLGDVGGVLQILSTVIAFIFSSYGQKAFIFDFMDNLKILGEKPRFSHMLCMSSQMRVAYDEFSNNLDEALNVIGILKAYFDFKKDTLEELPKKIK